MRSIRFSLIVCILILLVLSLGAISVLAYQITERTLALKNNNTRELLTEQYEERAQRAKDRLDKDLLADARNLVNLVKLRFQFPDARVRTLSVLGVLSAAASPQGHLQCPLWVAQATPTPLGWKIHRMRAALKFKEMDFPADQEGQIATYYQINTVSGDERRSPSMGNASFAFNPRHFGPKTIDWKLDTVELEPGLKVRHLVLKFSHLEIDWPRWRPPHPPHRAKRGAFVIKFGKGKRRGPERRNQRHNNFVREDDEPRNRDEAARIENSSPHDGPSNKRTDNKTFAGKRGKSEQKESNSSRNSLFTIYVHTAASTRPLNKKLAVLDEQKKKELADLEREYQVGLSQLRNTLLAINGGTFLAALLLGCVLVHIGLVPLRRLSDAVSKVSERDFRLPLETGRMPVELRPITERLHQTLDMLKRAFAREKQAAADISHELRTPLAAMMTTLELGLRKERSAEDYRELLVECQEAGQQMSQLVERLLALARLDAGVDTLRPRDVDVSHLARQCAGLVRPLAEARGLSLSIETNGPVTIKADPDKLREVLTNLLHNAIQYNKPHGKVAVAVHRENGHLEMEVSDTGIGIPPEAREHIFERFYRLDPSRHIESMHSGIGLALVKGYVDLMGGNISIDSRVGEGSTFSIRLPVQDNGSAENY